MTRQDIKYLETVSCPALTQKKVTVRCGQPLQLEVVLQPQELSLLHIFYRE